MSLKNKKILVIAPTFFFSLRGTPMRIFNHLAALADQGYVLDVITYPLGTNPFHETLQKCIRIIRVPHLLFWYQKNQAGPSYIKIYFDIVMIIRTIMYMVNHRPALIQAYHHEGIVIAKIMRKLFFWRPIIICADIHSSISAELVTHSIIERTFFIRIARFLEKKILNNCDVVFTSTQSLAVEIQQIVSKTYYIPDTYFFSEYYKRDENKYNQQVYHQAQPPTTSSKKIIMYTGGFTPDKGISELLDVFRDPQLIALDACVLWLAGGPRHLIEEIINNHPFKKNIFIISPFSIIDHYAIMRQADYYIDSFKSADLHQGSGKLVEYILREKPIICFRTAYNIALLGDAYPFVSSAHFTADLIKWLHNTEHLSAQNMIHRAQMQLVNPSALGNILDNHYQSLCNQSK